MSNKLEITIDMIVHATEDISKMLEPFIEMFDIEDEIFNKTETTGYFENPIILLNTKLVKKQAKIFMKKFLGLLSVSQINQLIEEIEERTEDSKFHLRLDKQEFVQGKLVFSQNDTIKIKIHTPVYNKKNTREIFSELFQSHLN